MTGRNEMRLIAVYDDEIDAERVVRALHRAGFTLADVEVEHLASVRPEMNDEAVHAIGGDQAPTPAEVLASAAVLGAVLGVIIAVPLAVLAFGALEIWSRWFVFTLVSAALGASIGVVVGAGRTGRTKVARAAECCITVAVASTPRAQSALLRSHPLRIDLVGSNGKPVEVLAERDDSVLLFNICAERPAG